MSLKLPLVYTHFNGPPYSIQRILFRQHFESTIFECYFITLNWNNGSGLIILTRRTLEKTLLFFYTTILKRVLHLPSFAAKQSKGPLLVLKLTLSMNFHRIKSMSLLPLVSHHKNWRLYYNILSTQTLDTNENLNKKQISTPPIP